MVVCPFGLSPSSKKSSFSRKPFSKPIDWQSRQRLERVSQALITPSRIQRQLYSAANDDHGDDDADQELNETLLQIAGNLKLNVVDDDGGGREILGLESKNYRYGIEVIQTQVSVTNGAGLGLVLTEVTSNTNSRGLVLISQVSGNALQAEPAAIHVGDVITAIRTTDRSVRERTTGLNYEGTVEAIGTVKKAAKDGILALELNRLVERAPISQRRIKFSTVDHKSNGGFKGVWQADAQKRETTNPLHLQLFINSRLKGNDQDYINYVDRRRGFYQYSSFGKIYVKNKIYVNRDCGKENREDRHTITKTAT